MLGAEIAFTLSTLNPRLMLLPSHRHCYSLGRLKRSTAVVQQIKQGSLTQLQYVKVIRRDSSTVEVNNVRMTELAE